jgi:WD40 repeat protein
MCGTIGTIRVYDMITGKQVMDFFFNSKERESDDFITCIFYEIAKPDGWPVICVCFGDHGLVVAISSSGTDRQLSFWKMASSCEITYLGHLSIPAKKKCTYTLGMDENFVKVSQYERDSRIFIVSTKTRTIVETLTDSSIKFVQYEQGLLLITYPSFIR